MGFQCSLFCTGCKTSGNFKLLKNHRWDIPTRSSLKPLYNITSNKCKDRCDKFPSCTDFFFSKKKKKCSFVKSNLIPLRSKSVDNCKDHCDQSSNCHEFYFNKETEKCFFNSGKTHLKANEKFDAYEKVCNQDLVQVTDYEQGKW